MKKLLSLLAVVMTLGLGTVHLEAEAKRIGSGRSLGMQRQATPPATPTAAPAAGATAGAAAAAAPKRNWMGPIAGLAAGLGIAALASHLGFGEGFANLLMIALLAVAAVALFRAFTRKTAPARDDGLAYAGAGTRQQDTFRTTPANEPVHANPGSGSMIGANLQPAARIPAGFDAEGFARNAKVQFIRLQAAHDAGNLDDIREFTSPEMFAELQMDIRERHGAQQETRVLELDAEVIEVVEDGPRYVASVRFTGRVQEDGAAPEALDEVWHLSKPVSGSGGWVLAGIQQTA